GVLVLLRRVLVEGRRVGVAQLDELVLALLDRVLVALVVRRRVVPVGSVVGPEGRRGGVDEVAPLALEEVELAVDDVGETVAPEGHGPAYTTRPCRLSSAPGTSTTGARLRPAGAPTSSG